MFKTVSIMSEARMNSYRFISGQDPTDEMLAQIMQEVAYEAEHRSEQATRAFFDDLHKGVEEMEAEWSPRINRLRDE